MPDYDYIVIGGGAAATNPNEPRLTTAMINDGSPADGTCVLYSLCSVDGRVSTGSSDDRPARR